MGKSSPLTREWPARLEVGAVYSFLFLAYSMSPKPASQQDLKIFVISRPNAKKRWEKVTTHLWIWVGSKVFIFPMEIFEPP